MAISKVQLFRRVKAEIATLRGEKNKPLRSDDFERVLPATVREIAVAAWQDANMRPYVTNPDPVAINFVAGIADLSGLPTLLIETLTVPPLAAITAAGEPDPLDLVRTGASLHTSEPRSVYGYRIEGSKIVTQIKTGGAVLAAGGFIYGAGFLPTVLLDTTGTLHDALVPALIAALVEKLNTRPTQGGDE